MKDNILRSAVAALVLMTSCVNVAKEQEEVADVNVARVLFIGDSITDGGWGNSCGNMSPSEERNQTDMNHIYGPSYMMLCASQIQSDFPQKDVKCFNRGISGNTLYDLAARWEKDAVSIDADLVSILVGTNDVEYYVSKEDQPAFDYDKWEATYRDLLDTLRCAKHDVKLVLCTPFVGKVGWRGAAPNFSLRQSMIDSLDVRVERIAADYGAVVVPFDSLFHELMENQPREDYWIWDGVHPTPAGHRRMADLWLAKVRHLL